MIKDAISFNALQKSLKNNNNYLKIVFIEPIIPKKTRLLYKKYMSEKMQSTFADEKKSNELKNEIFKSWKLIEKKELKDNIIYYLSPK